MPGVCPGGGGMLKLRFDRYIIRSILGREIWQHAFFLTLLYNMGGSKGQLINKNYCNVSGLYIKRYLRLSLVRLQS